jgi:lipoyl(octanoyl) transferase
MEARLSPVERLAAHPVWPERRCEAYSLGRMGYNEAWVLQRQWVEQRRAQSIPDRLLFVEHPPVITMGRNARAEHLLADPAELEREGIELIETNRGGDVTFHGPGQIVGYLIVDLSRIRKDVVWYVRTLEEAIIRAVEELGVSAERRQGMTGVWVGGEKVAAIGIHISRWITSHGFALNGNTDLSYFRHIVPCGIAAYPVSSLQKILGGSVDPAPLEHRLASHLGDLLGLEMQWTARQSQEGRSSCPPPMC